MKPVFASLIVAIVFAISGHSQEVIELSPEAIENLQLEFSKAEQKSIRIPLRATGVVRLNDAKVVEVVPRIEGVIAEDFQELGASVKPGDKLFRLESAELSRWLTAYVDAEQEMNFATLAFAQEKQLFDKELSSKEQLQEKELACQQAIAEHTRALQPLKILHFTENSIHRFLHNVGAGNYTSLEVKAETTGEIIEKNVRIGSAVKPGDSLYIIADLSGLWVDFKVSLRDAGSLEKGASVEIASSVSDQKGQAEVIYVAPLADEASRTVMARAFLKNDDHAWRPGTPVIVSSAAATSGETLSVPASALVDLGDGKAVFTREAETKFAIRPVETGPADGAFVEIRSGLEEGATVVARNAAQLKGHLEMTAEE